MKKIYFLLFASMVFTLPGHAQQKPQYNQYMLNGFLLNPAFTGIENYTDVKLSYRNQWTGMEGAPATYYLTVNGPLGKTDRSSSILSLPARSENKIINQVRYKKENDFKNLTPHHGVGGTIIADKVGLEKRLGLNFSYAYHLPVHRHLKLSSGIGAGFTRYSLNVHGLDFGQYADPVVGQFEKPLLLPEISLGTTLYGKNFFVGATVTQLLQDKVNCGGLPNDGQKRFANHYFIMGGYERRLSQEIIIMPSVLVKMVQPSPASVDFNLKVSYMRKMWGGVSYRHRNGAAALAGFTINSLMKVGYAYELPGSGLSQYHTGSHELMIGFILGNYYRTISPVVF